MKDDMLVAIGVLILLSDGLSEDVEQALKRLAIRAVLEEYF